MGGNRHLDDNAKRVAAEIIGDFGRRIADKILDSFEREAVSPPGWKGTVEKMKEKKEILNPWSLSWWMYNQKKPGGRKKKFKPHYTEEGVKKKKYRERDEKKTKSKSKSKARKKTKDTKERRKAASRRF